MVEIDKIEALKKNDRNSNKFKELRSAVRLAKKAEQFGEYNRFPEKLSLGERDLSNDYREKNINFQLAHADRIIDKKDVKIEKLYLAPLLLDNAYQELYNCSYIHSSLKEDKEKVERYLRAIQKRTDKVYGAFKECKDINTPYFRVGIDKLTEVQKLLDRSEKELSGKEQETRRGGLLGKIFSRKRENVVTSLITLSLLGSIILLAPSITGNTIATLNHKITNITGFVLFLAGLIGLLVYIKKRK